MLLYIMHSLHVPSVNKRPCFVQLPKQPKKYIIGFRSKEVLPIPNVNTKLSYVDKCDNGTKIDWVTKDPIMRQNVVAYHTMRRPLSHLMSIDVSEAELFIYLDTEETMVMHMYSALKYPLTEEVGLILVQEAVIRPYCASTYNCWVIKPLSPSTLFHGGLLEML